MPGVKPDASADEIRKRFRGLALKYHPDGNGVNPENEERLKELNEAYRVVGTTEDDFCRIRTIEPSVT